VPAILQKYGEMRKLDHREKKLLRKTDLYGWTNESNQNEAKVVRMYRLEDREDYQRYNKICGMITKLTNMLKTLKPDDKFRIQISEQLLDKLHQVGVVSKKNSLQDCASIPVAAFCRRRLGVILKSKGYGDTLTEAYNYTRQGHILLGDTVAKDPAQLVTRTMEDQINWSDNSKIKRKILQYKNAVDDYDLTA